MDDPQISKLEGRRPAVARTAKTSGTIVNLSDERLARIQRMSEYRRGRENWERIIALKRLLKPILEAPVRSLPAQTPRRAYCVLVHRQ